MNRDLSTQQTSVPGGQTPQARAQLIERLFREHNASLLHFLAVRLGSQQEAKEVAQEAYVRLLRLDAPGAHSYLQALLFRTASNLAIDRIRTRSYRERPASFEFFAHVPDPVSPERTVGGMQEVRLLLKLIESLPPRARYAFIQNKFHGLDVETIAKDMRITRRMVRAHIVRALMHCRLGLDAALEHAHDEK